MNKLSHSICLLGLLLVAACSDEPPPISVAEFLENPRLLEATMVRCAQNRSESRYLAECVNARDAVNRIEAAQEKTRREELEKQSERKRQALRRTQEAAAEARRRALEEEQRRQENSYLNIFDQPAGAPGDAVTDGQVGDVVVDPASNAPGVVVEPPENEPLIEEENAEPETDLEAIREELRRRQQSEN
jgi:hypothetical protein